MLSYHNDPKVKQKYVNRFAAHRAADEVIQGKGYEGGKGCFVGCTLNNYQHSQFPIELGWPEWLARLADAIFEGLGASDAARFGTDLLEAVPVGVNLEPVQWQLAIWRHTKSLELLEPNKEDYARKCKSAISQVIDYCRSKLAGTATEEQRRTAYLEARAVYAEESAAFSELRAAASSTAYSAAYSALDSEYSAAYSAIHSAAYSAYSAESAARLARLAYWTLEKNMLLQLVKQLGE